MKIYISFFLCFLIHIAAYSQNYIGLTSNELREEIEQNDDIAYWTLIPEKNGVKDHIVIRNKEQDDIQEYYFSKGVVNRYVIVTNNTRHYLYVRWLSKQFESNDFNVWLDYKQKCKWITELSGDTLKIIVTPSPDLKKQKKFLYFRQ